MSRKKADELLIGAEQFKATVAQPKGNPHVFEQFVHDHDLTKFIELLLDNDDYQFFHLTCHVDDGLKQKIEKGHYVGLERLFPRTMSQIMSEEQIC